MELLCQRIEDDIFKLQRNKTSRYGRNKIAKLYFNGANGKLLQNYWTQISRSQLFKMLRRRQYNSSCQPGIKISDKDNSKKTKAKIMEDKSKDNGR
ncbi:hypothetical protein H5410_004988 [Solanum commersonii]|uniref:Uncharacterized protein n=1 Tax=Solanum commersonii TaxID=4109 RepID=A0A9J6A5X6_SOLCO|nr:hypothetical protein H5410_004988 [Solanum commersonii]